MLRSLFLSEKITLSTQYGLLNRQTVVLRILIMWLCISPVRSQQIPKNIDSLKTELIKAKNIQDSTKIIDYLAEAYMYSSPEKGLDIAYQLLDLTQKRGYAQGEVDAYNLLGVNYYSLGNYEKALYYFNKGLEKLDNDKSLKTEDKYKIIGNIGFIYSDQGNYPKALESLTRVLDYFEKEKNPVGIIAALNNLGLLYQRWKEYGTALKFYGKATPYFKDLDQNNQHFEVLILLNTGKTYSEMKNYENSESYYFQALKLSEKINNEYTTSLVLKELGADYYTLGFYDKAEKYLNNSLKISQKINNKQLIAYNHGDLGLLFLKKAKSTNHQPLRNSYLNQSIQNLKSALKSSKDLENIKYNQLYSQGLSEAYDLTGNTELAFLYYKEAVSFKDSLFNEEKIKDFTRIEAEHDFQKREDSIQLVTDKEIAVRDATLKEKEKQSWLLISGLVIVSILGGLLLYQNILRKKKNEELEEANRIKTRFFSILNHDLRSPVSSLLQFLYLQKDEPEFFLDKNPAEIRDQTIDSVKKLLTTMEDLLLWSKGQMENFEPKIKSLNIGELFEELESAYSESDGVILKYETEKDIKLITDKNYLKTIIRNLTSNSIKALRDTREGKIIWRAYEENSKIILSITDNGPGGKDEQFQALYDDKVVVGIKTGLGLHLVRDMAKAIHCKIKVNSIIGKGTTINMVFDNFSLKA